MFELELFLGLAITPELQKKLDTCNPHLLKAFIKNGSEYLHSVTVDNQTYIGKHLGPMWKYEGFDFLCTNIYSILNRLMNSPCESYSLEIFTIPKESQSV